MPQSYIGCDTVQYKYNPYTLFTTQYNIHTKKSYYFSNLSLLYIFLRTDTVVAYK